ncbi:hypothetical protein [Promicromonospora soli]|uniref:Uncharacterized protein n=1 Tax=Promicromonospora soli TaxID=2035533 RepID=A0A919FP38_9MICO|nr:hypothetical protein [Promicromonospora soli]GHH69244.1 hypothetical protein GCM10017772_13900 [Promicromonospora soli]
MNQHDDGLGQDHGWVDPAGSGLLKQTFSAMAGGVDPASPTGPAAAMTAMSRRVRRRRTAKLGGLGGGALALAGALVLGAGQLAPAEQSELLPGASTPSSSAPDFQVKDGYQPPWLDWSDLTCGMPVADLKSTASGWSVAPAGDIYARTADLGGERSRAWGMAATLQEGKGTLDAPPVLVWSQDGVVLDLGPNVFEGWDAQSDPLLGTGGNTVAARGSSMTTCVPGSYGGDLQHETQLPDGDYEVRVVAFPETSAGLHATAVSDPVPVRLDVDGAHSPGEARAVPTIEFPKPAKGQVSRFELDRTTDWVSAEMTQQAYSSDIPMRVIGQCEGGDPEALLPIELVASTGDVVGTDQISCDGGESGTAIGVLSENRSGGVIDIRLPSVPDGVVRLWVSLEPETVEDGGAGPECSATGFEPEYVPGSSVTGSTAATAGSIVIAAMNCDSEALIALANDSKTEILNGTETPEQTFALPEPGTEHYRTLAALLTGTVPHIVGEGMPDASVVWPRVATGAFHDSDEAWAEVVAAGLLTAEEADAQRAEPDGYLGMRVTMDMSGRWKTYSTRG